MAKQYTGSVYIAVSEGETEDGRCRDSIEKMTRRAHDHPPEFNRATKGYESRQAHLNNWYNNTGHNFILFLDGDMVFPEYTLEKLRNHEKPYVSGLYLRRQVQPMVPIWFEDNEPGTMPIKPLCAAIPENRLFKIGASGWGCVLIHRDVITAMKEILRGEPEIIEDDMDVFPYDLQKVLKGEEQLRPLRGVKDLVGSDIRFPFYARLAGFEMYGDSGVMCEHMLHYPLSPMDYIQQSAAQVRDTVLGVAEQNELETRRLRKAVEVV